MARLCRAAGPLAVVMLCAATAESQAPAGGASPASQPPAAADAGRASLTNPAVALSATEQGPPPLLFGAEADRAFGLALECPLCATGGRWAPSPTSTAPWSAGLGAGFTVAGTSLGVSLLGSRNYRLPRYMAQPLGTSGDTTPPAASLYSDLSSHRTEWTVSARVQRTVRKFAGGRTLGVVADAWLPLNGGVDVARTRSNLPAPFPRVDVPLLPSRSIRVGLVFGF